MNFNARIFIDRPAGPVSLVPVLHHAVGAPTTVVVVSSRDVKVELRRKPDAAE